VDRPRAWLAWLIVALAGAGIVASFWLRGEDDAAGAPKKEAKVTPVSTAPVTTGTITERSRYPGELDADAADVAAFYTGRLVAVHVRVGDTVAKDAVLAELAKVGFDPIYGARPLRRAIQSYIENPLAKDILESRFGPKDAIAVDYANGAFTFAKVEQQAKAA
jgi:hypothetical protein